MREIKRTAIDDHSHHQRKKILFALTLIAKCAQTFTFRAIKLFLPLPVRAYCLCTLENQIEEVSSSSNRPSIFLHGILLKVSKIDKKNSCETFENDLSSIL